MDRSHEEEDGWGEFKSTLNGEASPTAELNEVDISAVESGLPAAVEAFEASKPRAEAVVVERLADEQAVTTRSISPAGLDNSAASIKVLEARRESGKTRGKMLDRPPENTSPTRPTGAEIVCGTAAAEPERGDVERKGNFAVCLPEQESLQQQSTAPALVGVEFLQAGGGDGSHGGQKLVATVLSEVSLTDAAAVKIYPTSVDPLALSLKPVSLNEDADDRCGDNDKQVQGQSEDEGSGDFAQPSPPITIDGDTTLLDTNSTSKSASTTNTIAPEKDLCSVHPDRATEARSAKSESPLGKPDHAVGTQPDPTAQTASHPSADLFEGFPTMTVDAPETSTVVGEAAVVAIGPSSSMSGTVDSPRRKGWASLSHGIWRRGSELGRGDAVEKVDGDWGDQQGDVDPLTLDEVNKSTEALSFDDTGDVEHKLVGGVGGNASRAGRVACAASDGQEAGPEHVKKQGEVGNRVDEQASTRLEKETQEKDAEQDMSFRTRATKFEDEDAGYVARNDSVAPAAGAAATSESLLGDLGYFGDAGSPVLRTSLHPGQLDTPQLNFLARDTADSSGVEAAEVGLSAAGTEVDWGDFGDSSLLPSGPTAHVPRELPAEELVNADELGTTVAEEGDWSAFDEFSAPSAAGGPPKDAFRDPLNDALEASETAEATVDPVVEIKSERRVEESKGECMPAETGPFASRVAEPIPGELKAPALADLEKPVQTKVEDPLMVESKHPVSAKTEEPVSGEWEQPVAAEKAEAAPADSDRPVLAGDEETVQAGTKEAVETETELPDVAKADGPDHVGLETDGGTDTDDWGEFEQPSPQAPQAPGTPEENTGARTESSPAAPLAEGRSDNDAKRAILEGEEDGDWGVFVEAKAPSAPADAAIAAEEHSSESKRDLESSMTPVEDHVRMELTTEVVSGNSETNAHQTPKSVEEDTAKAESSGVEAAEGGNGRGGSGSRDPAPAKIDQDEEEWSDFGDFEEAPTMEAEVTPAPPPALPEVPGKFPVERREKPETSPQSQDENAPMRATPAVLNKPPAGQNGTVESEGDVSGSWSAFAEPEKASSSKDIQPLEVTSSPSIQPVADRLLAISVAVFDSAFGDAGLGCSGPKAPERCDANDKGRRLESLVDVAVILCCSTSRCHERVPARLGNWATCCILRGIRPVPDALPLEDPSDDEDSNENYSTVRRNVSGQPSKDSFTTPAVSASESSRIRTRTTPSARTLSGRIVEPSAAPPPPPPLRRQIKSPPGQSRASSVQSSSPPVPSTSSPEEGVPSMRGGGDGGQEQGTFSPTATQPSMAAVVRSTSDAKEGRVKGAVSPPSASASPTSAQSSSPSLPAKATGVTPPSSQTVTPPPVPFKPDSATRTPPEGEGVHAAGGRPLRPVTDSSFAPFGTSFAAFSSTSEPKSDPGVETPQAPPLLFSASFLSVDGSVVPAMPQYAPPRVPSPPPRTTVVNGVGGKDAVGIPWTERTGLAEAGSDSDFGAWDEGSNSASARASAALVAGSGGKDVEGGDGDPGGDEWDDDPFEDFQSAPAAGEPSSQAPAAGAEPGSFDVFEPAQPPPEEEPPAWNLDFFMAGSSVQQPVRRNSDGVGGAGEGVSGAWKWNGGELGGAGQVTSGKQTDLISRALAGYGIADSPAREKSASLSSVSAIAIDGVGGSGIRNGRGGYSLSDSLRATRIRGGGRSTQPLVPLSAAAQARLAALPDLSFMLSSRIKFPMVAALVSPAEDSE